MLTASDVRYCYGEGTEFETVAVDGVDATVSPGRILLLGGETGSGKTTLLRLLAGLMRPTRGTIEAEGMPPEPAAADSRRRVGLMFQRAEAQLFAESVLDDVAFGPRNLGMPESRALEDVGLDPQSFGDRSPFTLSGGEARRVALAGVLALEPRYLLLDEPTAGLDAPGRSAVRDALTEARASSGVVVVTHDLEDFLELADDVLILQRGRVVFGGSVDSFLECSAGGVPGVPIPETVRLQSILRARGMRIPELSPSPEVAAGTIAERCGV